MGFEIASPGGVGSVRWEWIKPADPGAGNDWTVVIPVLPLPEEWELVTVQWKVTTGAVTQDRNSMFNIWDSVDGVDFTRDPYSGLVTLGGGAIYIFNLQQGRQINGVLYGSSISRIILGSLPVGNRYPAGFTFGSVTPNRRGDDVITEIRCLVKKHREHN